MEGCLFESERMGVELPANRDVVCEFVFAAKWFDVPDSIWYHLFRILAAEARKLSKGMNAVIPKDGL